jgi:deazaflavin-dependent oxidoreductase (nitroreductase family)
MSDFNTQIIEEFRTNDGQLSGGFEGMPFLLLHTTGAKSGQERVNPVAYQDLGGSVAVFASKAGADTNPDWYHNLVAHPEVSIEIGTETKAVTARIAAGAEREKIWSTQKDKAPVFAGYEEKTSREIPVIVLDDRS